MNDTNLRVSDSNLNALTLPITSRSPSYNSDSSSNFSPAQPTFSFSSPANATSSLLRGRAKTLASLTTSSKSTPQSELTPREVHLPNDPYVNGQPIEAYLYKDALECPICFLYYPPYLNRTRCCDQAICSECFVQIKRPDPHPPEHADPRNPHPPNPDPADLDSEKALVSEPAACPFCVQPEFGITYDPPPFRRGLTYVTQISSHPLANTTSAMSSSTSLGSLSGSGRQLTLETANRRRTTSLSANSPIVITTDRLRPDWAIKLATARANIARRSAAATALHNAAYLMGGRSGSEGRNFAGLGRRGMLRRGTGADSPSGTTSPSQLNMIALMTERLAAATREGNQDEASPSMVGPPRGSSRRTRVDELEDMMLMEAIRLSLASEEERRKKEEKEAKKEAKKKSKEEKKAEKAARKGGPYPPSTNQSATTLESPQSGIIPSDNGKGKGVQEGPATSSEPDLPTLLMSSAPLDGPSNQNGQAHLDRPRAQLTTNEAPSPYGSNPYKPSHLRTLSNVSSSASSIVDSLRGMQTVGGASSSFEASPNPSGVNIPHTTVQESFRSATPPGGGAGLEPMFNFRSLAAMIGTEETGESTSTVKDAEHMDPVTGTPLGPDEPSNMRPPGQPNASAEQSWQTLERNEPRPGPVSSAPDNPRRGDSTPELAAPRVFVQPAPDSEMAFKQREIGGMNHDDTQRETGSV